MAPHTKPSKKKPAKKKATPRKKVVKKAVATKKAVAPSASTLRRRFRGVGKSKLIGKFDETHLGDDPVSRSSDAAMLPSAAEVAINSNTAETIDWAQGEDYQVAPPGVPYVVDNNDERYQGMKMWEKVPTEPVLTAPSWWQRFVNRIRFW